MQHLDEGTIHAWLDGALDAEESARVEQHVAECAICANAVAEARGLVAGASRILAALDDVPSGVIPRSGGVGALGGESSAPRRPRSLWTYLHLTPARAAAAAFVIVAVGTALVMRQASEVGRRGVYSMAVHEAAPAPQAVVPATPLPAAPTIADSLATGRGAEARSANGPIRSARSLARVPVAAPEPAPRPLEGPVSAPRPAASAKKDVAQKQSGALSEVVVTSATSVPTVVGGAVSRAAPTAARVMAANQLRVNYAGCYSVAVLGDSLSAIPKLLSLDSYQLDKSLADQRLVDKSLADQRSVSPARFAVSTMTPSGRRQIDSASWQPLTNGVLISFGRTPLNLRAAADSTLSAAGVAGRGPSVTMQRVDCPPR